MKAANSPPVTRHSSLAARSDGRGLMTFEDAAKLFGYASGETLRLKEGPRGIEKLTVVDISRAGAQRRTLRLVESEVIALYDELLENARERTNVERMVSEARPSGRAQSSHLRDVSKAVNG